MISIRSLLLLLALCAPASAQQMLLDAGPVKYATAPTYTGPGDIVSGAAFWWGLRAYSAAVAAGGTQKAINVRNTGTNETCDVLIATSGGLASTVTNCSGSSSGTALSTFCSSCAITKWYDQSGANSCTSAACDVSQTTAAQQGTLTLSCLGSLPCGVVSGASTQFWTAAATINANNAAPHSYMMVVNDTAAGTNIFLNFGGSTNNSFYYASQTSLHVTDQSNDISGTVSNQWNVNIASVVSGTNASTVNSNGTTVVTGTLTTHTGNAPPTLGAASGPFDAATGDIAEAGAWPASLASSYTSLCHNAHTYWGTPTSC